MPVLALDRHFPLTTRPARLLWISIATVAGSERLEAFRRETERLGLDLRDEYVRQGDFSSASGYREACALLALPERPTAIVAASDLMALAALQSIREVASSRAAASPSSASTTSRPRRSRTRR